VLETRFETEPSTASARTRGWAPEAGRPRQELRCVMPSGCQTLSQCAGPGIVRVGHVVIWTLRSSLPFPLLYF